MFLSDTPLHIACKSSQVEITEFLLSIGECDLLCKNADFSGNKKASQQFLRGTYPLESVLNVFILGDPLAGKSSLVQALKCNPGFMSSLIG